jgi:hypothetical protein
MQTLNHYLSTLRHFIPNDRTRASARQVRAAAMQRCYTTDVEWLSVGTMDRAMMMRGTPGQAAAMGQVESTATRRRVGQRHGNDLEVHLDG